MSNANPVAQLLDSLDNSKMTVGLGDDARRQIHTKRETDGSHTQVVTIREAAAQAGLTIANTVAVEGNTQEIGELTDAVSGLAPLIETQNAVADDTLEALTALNLKINTLNGNIGSLITLQTAANQMAQQSLAAAQQTASASAAGANWAYDFTGAGGTSVFVSGSMPSTVTADGGVKILRVVLSAATLLGTILGGGAKVYVYHCAGASDAYNAAGAVLLGTYPVASNSSYAVLNGRVVPKGRYLRVQASNGGCSITLDVA